MSSILPSTPPETLPASGTMRHWTPILGKLYRAVGYVGLMSIAGSQIFGFRHNPQSPAVNYLFNVLLYGAFIVPHLVMTRAWFKQAVWGNPAGSATERRVYILVSVASWFAVLLCQWPLPGAELSAGPWRIAVQFLGVIGFLWSVVLFFQGVTFGMLDGLLAAPGAATQFSHGGETPLLTDGPYAEVRHPMYRAMTMIGLSSLAVHPNLAQLFWVAAIVLSFVAFIPIEEAQLLAARRDDYRRYQKQTPYRLFRGVW